MKTTIKDIYVTWRPERGCPRMHIGTLKKDGSFRYNMPTVSKLKKLNSFEGYPGISVDKEEHKDALQLFEKRLINTERTGAEELLNFWNVDVEYKEDKIYLLGMTQGIMQTDNFEFLADFDNTRPFSFITDIAGLSHNKLNNFQSLKIGDALEYRLDPANEYDKYAVLTTKNNKEIGYVKQFHNRVFYENKVDIKIIVHNVIPNDRLYVKIIGE